MVATYTAMVAASLLWARSADAYIGPGAGVAERDVSVSTVFVTLTRLEDQGLVRSARGEAPARGGRQTRIFTLTEAGWEALRRTREASERLWSGLEPG